MVKTKMYAQQISNSNKNTLWITETKTHTQQPLLDEEGLFRSTA